MMKEVSLTKGEATEGWFRECNWEIKKIEESVRKEIG